MADIMQFQQVQPNLDLLGGMKSLADLQMAESHASLFGAQARQVNLRQAALQQYAAARAKGDPNALNIIASVDPTLATQMQTFEQNSRKITAQNQAGEAIRRGDTAAARAAVADFPEVSNTAETTRKTQVDTQQEQLKTQITAAGSIANRALTLGQQAEKGEITPQVYRNEWNKLVVEAHGSGLFGPGAMGDQMLNNLWDKPDMEAAKRLQSMAITGQQAIENTGAPAGAQAQAKVGPALQQKAGEARIDVAKEKATPKVFSADANYRAQDPSALDALNLGYSPTQNTPMAAGPAVRPAVTPATIPGAQPMAPQGLQPGPAILGQQPPTQQQGVTPEQQRQSQMYDSMPVNTIHSTNPNLQPGEQQGTPKYLEELIKDANAHVTKTIIPDADAAQLNYDAFSRMEAKIDQGLKTGLDAPARMNVAAAIYGLTHDYGLAKKISGIDITDAKTFEKEATRAGLQFARQTEGAREAVQAIKIALGANPQLSNDTESNRKIIGVLKETARWSVERGQAAQMWAEKQAKEGHDGANYYGFQSWWNKNHPLSEFTSRSVPLSPPKHVDELQNNTTYEIGGKRYVYTGKVNPKTGNPLYRPG